MPMPAETNNPGPAKPPERRRITYDIAGWKVTVPEATDADPHPRELFPYILRYLIAVNVFYCIALAVVATISGGLPALGELFGSYAHIVGVVLTLVPVAFLVAPAAMWCIVVLSWPWRARPRFALMRVALVYLYDYISHCYIAVGSVYVPVAVLVDIWINPHMEFEMSFLVLALLLMFIGWALREIMFGASGFFGALSGMASSMLTMMPARTLATWKIAIRRSRDRADGGRFVPACAASNIRNVCLGEELRAVGLISDTHFAAGAHLERTVGMLEDPAMMAEWAARMNGACVVLHAGDITDEGSSGAWALAIAQLSHLGVPVIACPGNHDVNYRQIASADAKAPSQFRQSDIVRRILSLFHHTVPDIHPLPNFGFEPGFPLWFTNSDLRIEVLCFDSNARAPGTYLTNAIGHVSSEALATARAIVSKNSKPANTVRILMLHHHVLHPGRGLMSLDTGLVLENPEDVMEFARGHGFDYIVHGHRHDPSIREHDGIRIISCGSARHRPAHNTQISQSCYAIVLQNEANRRYLLRLDVRPPGP